MPAYKELVAPTEGESILLRAGQLQVPDAPIVPFIEGDGTGPDIWSASRLVFDAAVTRMATLAEGHRITEEVVADELEHLRNLSASANAGVGSALVAQALGPERAARLDRFDRVQLQDVLSVCQSARSLSAAGRELFAASRSEKTSVNDADRLRKYLSRFDLDFAELKQR